MCARLPLSAAYFDPAYINCLSSAITEPELVQQFCRLYGSKLDSPQRTDEDMGVFSKFVHDCIYTRLPEEAIASLRSAAGTT